VYLNSIAGQRTASQYPRNYASNTHADVTSIAEQFVRCRGCNRLAYRSGFALLRNKDLGLIGLILEVVERTKLEYEFRHGSTFLPSSSGYSEDYSWDIFWDSCIWDVPTFVDGQCSWWTAEELATWRNPQSCLP
jgi:hypothetical protein